MAGETINQQYVTLKDIKIDDCQNDYINNTDTKNNCQNFVGMGSYLSGSIYYLWYSCFSRCVCS